jgi:endoglucanase
MGRKWLRRISVTTVVLLAVFGIAAAQATTPTAATSYVRVNQVGYELGKGPDRAYLMTTGAAAGAAFRVVDSAGHTAYRGRVGDRVRAWSTSATAGYQVYPLDFRMLRPGTFTIAVSGVRSPKFPVAALSQLYEKLLGNTLFYYRSVRDGSDYVKGPLSPAPAHLNDSHAATYYNPSIQDSDDELLTTTGKPLTPYGTTIDASGGHWDAGDNLKYVETESYETALMQLGVRDFPRQMGPNAPSVRSRAGATTPDFSDEADFGMDFLSRMWDDKKKVLYFQVGNTQDWVNFPDLRGDYDFWRLPQADDTAPDSPAGDPGGDYSFIRNRPVFVAGAPGSHKNPAGAPISPNLAGRLAADFAIYYQLHRTTDVAKANQALKSAEDILGLADLSYADPATDSRKLLTIIPFDGYGEQVWDDDMAFGATELYFALKSAGSARNLPGNLPDRNAAHYLSRAAHFASRYNALPATDKDTLNLYDVGSLENFELYRAMDLAGNPRGLEITRPALLHAITTQLDAAQATAATDAWGFGRNWRSGDTTSFGDGLTVMAQEADYLSHQGKYDATARQWLGNMMGANPWGVSLIIGAGDVWTKCPQQQPANLLGSLTGGAPELWGAAVEGPTSEAASGGYDTMRACPPGGGDSYAAFNGNDGAFKSSKTAVYKDNVESYSTTEPAIDLTATSFLMFSWRQAGAPGNWTSTTVSTHARGTRLAVTATVSTTGSRAPRGTVSFHAGSRTGPLLGKAHLFHTGKARSTARLTISGRDVKASHGKIVAYFAGDNQGDGPSTSLPTHRALP